MIELALVMPMLTVLLVGMLEFGRVYFAAIEVTNAARAGVAFGARNLSSSSNTAGMIAAAKNDASDNISGTMVPSAGTICTCSDGTSVACPTAAATCVSPLHALIYVKVDTQAAINPLFHVPGLPTTYTVHGHAKMQVQ